MSSIMTAHLILACAIAAEVVGSSFLKASDGFSRLWPSVAVVGFYCVSFYLLAVVLKVLPLGYAYAIWSGLGIVLTAMVGWLVYRQMLDLGAIIGMGLIISGVVVMNLFSNMSGH